jgi:AcrR family transcriptional regulator
VIALRNENEVTTQRSAGRPRGREKPRTGDTPRQEIVEAAARLFVEKGYTATTMSDIAREAGLHQSSVYYWFSRKEAILHEALMIARAPVDYVVKTSADDSPALKIYRLLHFDTLQMALANIDFNEIEIVATNYYSDFVEFWRDYSDLHHVLLGLIEDAIAAGEFIPCDAHSTALTMLSVNEGTQKRFRRQKNHDPDVSHEFTHQPLPAEEWAHLSASTSIRAMLRRPEHATQLREAIDGAQLPAR